MKIWYTFKEKRPDNGTRIIIAWKQFYNQQGYSIDLVEKTSVGNIYVDGVLVTETKIYKWMDPYSIPFDS